MTNQLTDSPDYDIRFSGPAEEEKLKAWISDPACAPWYPPDSEPDREVFIKNWIGFSKFKSSLTATCKGEAVGIATIYLMPYIKVAHVCSLYMIVDPHFQRQGVGSSLLRNIKHLAKTRFRLEAMHAEVFGSCPAIGMLEKGGFSVVFSQKEFIDFPEGPRARIVYEAIL